MSKKKSDKKKRPVRTHIFYGGVEWREGRIGEVFAGKDRQSRGIMTSAPVFGGFDGAQNPEDMLLCALAQCTMSTFLHFVNANEIDLISYENSVKGTLTKGRNGFSFTEYLFEIKVTVAKGHREKAAEAIKLAERFCLVSNSLNGEKKHKYRIYEREKKES